MSEDKKKGGQWTRGISGNPQGKAPGTGTVQKLRAAIGEHIADIIDTLVFQARMGDVQSAKLLLERVLPVVRPESLPALLPELATAEGFTAKGEVIFAALAQGQIAPDMAAVLITALGQAARTNDIEELERRLARLEQEDIERLI